jgi:hypothetical protein
MKFHRLVNPARVLIAAVVVCMASASAKAETDYTLTVSGDGVNLSYTLNSTNGYTATYTGPAAGGQIGSGISFNVTASSNTTGGYAAPVFSTPNPVSTGVELSGSVSNNVSLSGGNATLTFTLTSFTSNQGTAPATAGAGAFANLSPGGIGAINLLTSAAALVTGSTATGSISTATQGYQYAGGAGSNTAGTGTMISTQPYTVASSTTPTYSNGAFTVTGQSFNLVDTATNISVSNGTLNFAAASFVSLPEPGGILAFAAGCPCVFGLLGVARRLKSASKPVVA